MTDGSHVVRAVCVHADCGAELVVRQPPCALGPPEITLLSHFVTRLDERSHRARRVVGAMVAACIFAVPTVSAARCLSSMTMYEASLAWLPVPVVTLLSGIALGLLALAALTDESQERRLLLGLVDGAPLCAAESEPSPPRPSVPSLAPYRTSGRED
ncbi:MAG: hypothetical protein KC657_21530 [Myxococcales bacterium]|nr:hypothetical protein [Myxococcales bacterium]